MGGKVARERLAGLAGAADGEIELVPAALALSALDRPEAHIEDYLPHIQELAWEIQADGPRASLAAVMEGRHGYRGDHDDVAGTSLMWVIEHRHGTAEAVGLLALEAARRAGWQAEALAFPARFLLRVVDAGGRRMILDPACSFAALEAHDLRAHLKACCGLSAELAPGHTTALSNRDILMRLQSAAKHRLLRRGAVDRALAVVEATLLFAPDHPPLWREAGMMHLRLDQLPAAVAALEQFVARTGNQQARHRTAELLQQLRHRLN